MGTKVRARRWRDSQDQPGVDSVQSLQLFFLSSLPDAASLEVWMAHGLLGRRQSSLENPWMWRSGPPIGSSEQQGARPGF